MANNTLKFANAIKVGSLTSDPSPAENGMMYYNTTLNVLRQYVGGSWTTVSAGSVSLTGQALNEGEIIVGSSSNLSAAVDTDTVGDITASSTGGLTYKVGSIDNADISASAAIALTKLAALTATRVVVTDASGFLTVATYTPSDVILRNGSVPFTAAQSMGGFKLTSVADPTSAQDAATKNYVDLSLQGVKPKQAVRAATTGNITLSGAQTIDGISVVAGNRVLVKDQTTTSENGIYVASASAWSRATDFDSISPIDEINGAWVGVQEGTANGGKVFIQYTAVSVVDTDPILFTYFSDLSSLIGGDMITVSGTTVSVDLASDAGLESSNPGNAAGQLRVKLDGTTLARSSSGLKVADAGITSTQIATSVAGDGLSGGAGTALAVNVDGSTIEINADTLRVKDAGITDAKVATGISAAKIGAGTVDNTEFGYLDGVTSSIQTQINNKLSSVSQDTAPSLGGNLDMNNFALLGKMHRAAVATPSNWVEEEYFHALTLTASQTAAVETSLSFAHASFEGVEISYKIKEATTNRVRIGKLMVATDGTNTSVTDTYTETADVGVTWTVGINGATLEVKYTTTTNNKTMRADVKRIKA